MTSGRTSPALCGCEDSSGNNAGDFVVKLRGGIERGATGLLCEFLGSRIASYFEIQTPPPAIVSIGAAFASLVSATEPSKTKHMSRSIGLNFGSRQVTDVTTWPVDKPIPAAMRQAAAAVFAFDALIQNPDRRFNPTNLFIRGDQIIVFDHETAFSFLEDIGPASDPWRLSSQRYLPDHVFSRLLKSLGIEYSPAAKRGRCPAHKCQ